MSDANLLIECGLVGNIMQQDLKKENITSVFFIMTASLACSAFIQIDIGSSMRLIDYAYAGGGGVVLSAILVMLSNLVSADLKQKLVFLRLKNELPASRIHRLCRSDPRIEYDIAKSRWPEVFDAEIDEATRNIRWYQQIYKSVKDSEEVRQSHRNFLLYRDAFSGLLIILLITVATAFAGELAVIGKIKITTILMQAVFVLLALIAANVAGKRFVVNAVAVA